MSGTGKRFDSGKSRLELLPPEPLIGISAVLAFGASKYGSWNWMGGMAWSRVLGSLLRHTLKFMAGEDLDSESGLPHVDHIATNALFLSQYYRTHKKLDDRYKPPVD